ncbi:MAG: hypothetical protein LBT23_00590 [Synergistaceae bacterium]|jgi:hypothetical protein|nr:hypothetical protein [Synergistaceae bacterium]
MPRIIAEIGRKLSRIFLGRIVVRDLGALKRENSAAVMTHFRQVDVKPLRTEARVGAALFVQWRSARPKSAGSILGTNALKNFKVHRATMRSIKKCRVAQYKFTLERRAAPRRAMGRINRVPSTRRNRLNFLKKQPKFERSSLLALYSPIFQEKVTKSALDKSSGNLLFWYDSERVKVGGKYHLLLLRVFGGEAPLKWVWLPADKKIS